MSSGQTVRIVTTRITAVFEVTNRVPPFWWLIPIVLLASVPILVHNTTAYDLQVIYQGVTAFTHRQPVYSSLMVPGAMVYVFPPSSLLLLAPMALCRLSQLRLLYPYVEVTSITASILVSLRLQRVRIGSPLTVVLLSLAAFFAPVQEEVRYGNVDGIVLLPMASALLAMSSGRQVAAGLLLALGLAIKPTIAPLLLIPIVFKQVRTLLVALSVAGSLVLLGAVLTTDAALYFTATIPFVLSGEHRSFWSGNLTLGGLLTSLGLDDGVVVAFRLLLVLVALWAIRKLVTTSALSRPERVASMAGILILTTELASSYSFLRYAVYAIPALVVIAVRREPRSLAVAGAGALLLLFTSSRFVQQYAWWQAIDLYRFTTGSLLLLISLLVLTWRSGRTPKPPIAADHSRTPLAQP